MSRCAALRGVRAGVLAAAIATAIPLVQSPPATAAPSSCPGAHPPDELSPGHEVHGLTVEAGMQPDPFTGEVLGLLRNGVTIGVDLIVVEVHSDAIDRAGGVWSGMSGSPVYADDGRLIGAIAYGLSWGASPIAGVTPAEAMYELLGPDGVSATADRDVGAEDDIALPGDIGDEIVASGAASPNEVASGLTRLAIPLGVSGLGADRYAALEDRLGERLTPATIHATGSTTGARSSAPLVPGGNVAAAVTNGAVTLTATGTVTAICGDDALMFGHPVLWSGRSRLGVHRATSLAVHPGSGFEAGFKVAQPLGLVGVTRQDRLAGVRARIGVRPTTTPITGTLVGPDGAGTTATTRVVNRGWVPLSVWAHVTSHVDSVADGDRGTVLLDWTARGRRADGTPWRVRRHDAATRSWFGVGDLVAQHIRRLHRNGFERISVDRVRYEGSTSRAARIGRVAGLERRVAGEWVRVRRNRPLALVAGRQVRLRALVRFPRVERPTPVPLVISVPRRAGQHGALSVAGGSWEPWSGPGRDRPHSLDDLLRSIRRAPAGDEVIARLTVRTDDEPVVRQDRARTTTIVRRVFRVPVIIVRPGSASIPPPVILPGPPPVPAP